MSIESRIDMVSYFEKRHHGRMMSVIGRLKLDVSDQNSGDWKSSVAVS